VAEEPKSEVAKMMQLGEAKRTQNQERITREQVVNQTRSMIKTLTSTMAGLPVSLQPLHSKISGF